MRNNISKLYGIESDLEYTDNVSDACLDGYRASWDYRFLNSLIGKNNNFKINRFCETPIPEILKDWAKNIQGFSSSMGVAFVFRLEYPKDLKNIKEIKGPKDTKSPKKSIKSRDNHWKLAFYLKKLYNSDKLVPLSDLWKRNLSKSFILQNFSNNAIEFQTEILHALGSARNIFQPIERSFYDKYPEFVQLTTQEVILFLKYEMYVLKQNGFQIILPEQFRSKGEQRLNARLVVKSAEIDSRQKTRSKKNYTKASMFDASSMINFHWEATLEGKKLTDDEFLQLAETKEPLAFLGGQWVLINQRDMEALKPIFKDKNKISGKMKYFDALKLGMTGGVNIGKNKNQYEVVFEGNFQSLVDNLKNLERFDTIIVPENFNGKLREYQKTALTWLGNMSEFNLGVCLADDMGLGKTIEIIAFLLYRTLKYENLEGSVLIVCPTSVLFNWTREIKNFGPILKIIVNHGSNRYKDTEAVEKFTNSNQIILTTYGTVRNDIEFLESITFAGIIIDESQNIKNYKTQQTKAILKLKGQYRIALSGTPIENSLKELWTLFEFLNPGLLGSQTSFHNNYTVPIERFQEEEAVKKLKQIINPFIMRRLKTDKKIIKDLPEKNEIKIYIELSTYQKIVYSKLVKDTLKSIENLEQNQIERKGLILKLLTQTKQICNHPFQFQHLTEDKLNEISFDDFTKKSTKVKRLFEMIEEILEDGGKLLIFTQFTQMGDLLKNILERKYQFPILYFHGGIPQKKRGQIIDEFQSKDINSPPIMILSLRAGGVGLNLTEASTVFHFDRWWNPAVEDQATDRVYRIGQEKTVNVYKFISVETIEEKIDKILEEKRNLADKILAKSSQKWITDLSNEELKELFSPGTQN